ncbi:MAG: DUF2125 domain-containing protein [Pseudomonadota bacterium]
MRRLLNVVLVLCLLWCGYWLVASIAIDRGIRAWLDDRRGEGWVADLGDLGVGGFPSRFVAEAQSLELADPETGLSWSLPRFEVQALAYQPYHVIARWPDQFAVATPFERLTVTSSDLDASLVVTPSTAAALERSSFVARAFRVASSAGWSGGAAEMRLATRQTEVDNAHEIGIEAKDVRLTEPIRRLLDPLGALPDAVETLRLNTEIAFDRPWDRFAIERARPQPTAIDLEDLTALWGDLELRAAGEFEIDAAGLATGNVTVKAVNWREMLDIAETSGALPSPSRPSIERALEVLAGLSGRPDTIDAPLTLRGGIVFLGPLPLGALPPIRIR